ncbi:MAG: peptidylprolyl isomerase [Cyclobacteriaceae bacterium]|nr:peptidylprolyl isomerase [Cyclobacteriaceae bacterium HetDA_MAG_MS6]
MKKLLTIVLVGLVLASCNDNKDYIVTIHTSLGDMKVLLYNETPLHKQNFLELARSGQYDSTKWHRIIENFMIQGGDVYEKQEKQENPSDLIPAEIVDQFWHVKGALAAARQGDQVNPEKKSSSCQFYIVHGKQFSEAELTTDQVALNRGISTCLEMDKYADLLQQFIDLQRANDIEAMNNLALANKEIVEKELGISVSKPFDPEKLSAYTTLGGAPHLDGAYTVFGKVVEGLDVIDQIASVKTGRADKPIDPLYLSMEVEAMPKKEISKKYGYQYPNSK